MATKPKMMEEVPSEIADKLQTMRNNRAAENYKRSKESVVAKPKTAKPVVKAKAPVKKVNKVGYNSEGKPYPSIKDLSYNGVMFDED